MPGRLQDVGGRTAPGASSRAITEERKLTPLRGVDAVVTNPYSTRLFNTPFVLNSGNSRDLHSKHHHAVWR